MILIAHASTLYTPVIKNINRRMANVTALIPTLGTILRVFCIITLVGRIVSLPTATFCRAKKAKELMFLIAEITAMKMQMQRDITKTFSPKNAL